MGVNILEFCTPPIPGQPHKYYGNAHNNFIKLPVAIPHTTIQKTVSTNNSLHSIATSGNLTLLKSILPFLPTPQKAVNEPHPSTGLTPLHFAASRGHFNIVKYLVDDYSAVVDAKDREGETALLKAAYNGHYHIVKYLVSKNANIHSKDKDGWTALHNACARGFLPIARLLIEKGARVDVKSKMGHTPLINAASKGYISIVEYLLVESHANPLIKNNFGEAAYDVSAAAGESYICEMLHRAGKSWWQMQHSSEGNGSASRYNLLDFHVTVMVVIHENERSSSYLGLSKPQFSTASLTKHDVRGPWSLSPSGRPSTKEEVQLPQNSAGNGSDWFWLTDWQIDYSDPRIDPTSGWQYARSFDDPDDVWTPVTPTSGYGWVRRRIWVRVMKRRMDLLKGSHIGSPAINEEEDYLCEAEDIVQNSKLDPAVAVNEEPSIQQLTIELRAYEEAVQLLRAGIKNDGNQFRIHQANTLITAYTSQIDALNLQITQLAHTVSTPITPLPVQHNAELARELGFNDRQAPESSDFDTNPWTRDANAASDAEWQASSIESTSFNHVNLIGHGMDNQQHEHDDQDDMEQHMRGPKQYVWESDLEAKECRGCRRRFGLLVRRHHCRCCGLIHCDRCSMSRARLSSTQILQDPNGPLESLDVLASQHQRVCDTCYAKLGGIPP
ncbi:ankyrin [Mucor lusitanicus]